MEMLEMLRDQVTASPLFGVFLTIIGYLIGVYINKKMGKAIFNSLLMSFVVVIGTLLFFRIPIDNYNIGGNMITNCLAPVTAVLAISIYRQRQKVKENLIPILVGTTAGSITSVFSMLLFAKLFGFDWATTASVIPKSVTTAISIAIADTLGGYAAIAAIGCVIAGSTGNMLSPFLIKIFHLTDPVAQGLAIGTSSHALGTSKAIEIGEIQGAFSSIAITFAGLITVIITLLLFIA